MVYDSNQFLEKNRDTLSKNVAHLLRGPKHVLVAALFNPSEAKPNATISRSQKGQEQSLKLSVSANFKNSLLDLMDKMLAATPHFIRCVIFRFMSMVWAYIARCIKPNKTKSPLQCDHAHMLLQLRYTGVLETTRIRRDGYAVRLPHDQFLLQ